MTASLMHLERVRREYPAGDGVFAALKDIDVTIQSGELLAIMGPSGSGKSTLMNILGCLDRPTSGVYQVLGEDTAQMDADALAALRRERFGFIFQRYNLLADLTALANVEVPAVYADIPRQQRHERARGLLLRLGLGERLAHRPGQLSGGQQQRVSIARALMNGGEVILADEPTGSLDSHAGEEVLSVLKELHSQGHTIIIVTHDLRVAQHAGRIIELRDGAVVSDQRFAGTTSTRPTGRVTRLFGAGVGRFGPWDRTAEALSMALLAMRAHRLRTFLTMLGIIIGIASVASVVALGEGGQKRILADIRGIGTNTIDIYPGDWGDEKSASIHTLTPADADALSEESFVDSVTPAVTASASLRFGNVSVNESISGVGDQYFRARGIEVTQGASFTAADVRSLAQVALIDDTTRQKLFAHGQNPLGQVVFLGSVPVRVIGVGKPSGITFGPSQNLNVWAPYTTIMGRILGESYLKGITVRIKDDVPTELAAAAVNKILRQRHGRKDFYLFNSDTIRKTIESTTATLTLLIASIALISLIVGGIGVMNIMLVSVTERTREIGVRTAVGARRSDILRQFLIEAVLICLIGGALGVALALALGVAFSYGSSNFPMLFSTSSIVAAVGVSTLIGVVFGFLPARNAARLDPVQALARE
jgi:macrolide transport system ATP-binding/permease protein